MMFKVLRNWLSGGKVGRDWNSKAKVTSIDHADVHTFIIKICDISA